MLRPGSASGWSAAVAEPKALGNGSSNTLELHMHHVYPPPCLPAQHGVLFFVQFVLAGTSSGTSADVRESDRGERDSSLSGGRPPEMPENVAL